MMAIFAYIRGNSVGDPTPTPQIFQDENVFKYLVKEKRIVVVAQHPMTPGETGLSIDDLVKRFPYKGG